MLLEVIVGILTLYLVHNYFARISELVLNLNLILMRTGGGPRLWVYRVDVDVVVVAI